MFECATADLVYAVVRKTVVSRVMACSDMLKVVVVCGCQVRHICDLGLLVSSHCGHALWLRKLKRLANAFLSRTVLSIFFDALILGESWQKVMQWCDGPIWRSVHLLE